MSSIDERVVQMQFENSQFEKGIKETVKSLGLLKKELNVDKASESLEHLQSVGDSFSLSKISNQLEKIVERTSWFGRTIRREIDSIAAQAINLGKSLSVGQVSAGWSKYEQKTASVQTIINATGKSIDEVNGYLDKLMWFSDETSYNFTEMTAALGTLTSSGGDIDKMIPMIEGMATATAFAGKTAAEFSRVIYNLNQSYSQGYLSLMDWKSVELAQVGSEQLKQTLIDTAVELGTLKKLSDGTFKTKKGTIVNAGNMGSTLNEKWATKEVMEGAFGKFSQVIEEAYKLVEAGEFDTAADAIASLAGKYDETYYKAAKAAQEAKSFKEAVDATADAVSSGWMKTFELIFGNYEEARVLWTDLANALWEVFASGAEQRNETLEAWKEAGGRTDLIEGITDALNALWTIITTVKDAFRDIFPKATSDDLLKISSKVKELGKSLKELATRIEYIKILSGERKIETNPLEEYFGDLEKGAKGDAVKKLQQALIDKGFDVGKHGVDGIFGKDTEAALKAFQESIGETADGIYKEGEHAKLVGTITESKLEHIEETARLYTPFLLKIKRIASGLFSVLKILGEGILFVGKVAGKVISLLTPFVDVLLTIFASLGDGATAVGEWMDEVKPFDKWLERIDALLNPVRIAFEKAADSIKKFFGFDPKTGKKLKRISQFAEAMAKVKTFLQPVLDWFSTAYDKIKKFFGIGTEMYENGELVPDRGPSQFVRTLLKIKDFLQPVLDWFDIAKKKIRLFFGLDKEYENGEEKIPKFLIVWSKIKTYLGPVVDWIKNFAISAFSKFKDVLADIPSYFEKIKEFVSGKFASITKSDKVKNVIDAVKSFVTGFWNGLKEAFSGITSGSATTAFEKFKDLVTNVWDGLMKIIDTITVKGSNIAKMLMLFAGAKGLFAVVLNLKNFAKLILDVGDVVKGFSKLGSGVTGLFTNFGKVGNELANGLKDWDKKIIGIKSAEKKAQPIGKTILQFALSLGLIAAAIYVLGNMDEKKLIQGGKVAAAIFGALFAMSVASTLLDKVKTNGNGLGQNALKMALALLVVAGAIYLFGTMKGDVLKQGLKTIQLIGLGFAAFMIAMRFVGSKQTNYKGLLSMSLALVVLSYAVKRLGLLDNGVLAKGLVSVGLIFLIFTLFMKTMKNSGSFETKYKGLMSFALAIGILGMIVKMLGTMDLTSLTKGLAALAVVVLLMKTLMRTMSSMSKDGSATMKFAGLIGLGILLVSISHVIKTLGAMDFGSLIKGLAGLAVIMLMIKVILDSASKMSDSGSVKVILKFGGMVAIVMLMAKVVKDLGKVPLKELAKGLGALSVIMGLLALVMRVGGEATSSADFTSFAGMLIVFAGFVYIFGIVLKQIKDIDPLVMVSFAGSLSLALISLASACAIAGRIGMKNMLKGAASIGLAITVLVAIVGALMWGIGKLGSSTTMTNTIKRSIPVLKAVGEAVDAIMSSSFGAVIGAIVAVSSVLAMIPRSITSNSCLRILGNTAILSLSVATVIAIASALFTAVGEINYDEQWAETISKSVPVIKSVSEAITAMADSAFGDVVLALVGIGTILSQLLGPAALKGALIGTAVSGILSIAIGAVMAIGAAIFTAFGSIQEASDGQWAKTIEDGIPVFEAIGKAIGAFIGAIKSQAIVTMTSELNSLGETGLDSSKVEQVIGLAEDFKDFYDRFEKVTAGWVLKEWVIGLLGVDSDFIKFCHGIGTFGKAVGSYASQISGVPSDIDKKTDTAVKAAKKIKELYDTFETEGFFEAAWKKLGELVTGGSEFDNFCKNDIPNFVTAINDYSEELNDLDDGVVTNTNLAVKIASSIASFIHSLQEGGNNYIEPAKGGLSAWISWEDTSGTTFLGQMSLFATKINELGTTLSGLSASNVQSDVDEMVAIGRIIASFFHDLGTPDEESSEMGEGIDDYYNAASLTIAGFISQMDDLREAMDKFALAIDEINPIKMLSVSLGLKGIVDEALRLKDSKNSVDAIDNIAYLLNSLAGMSEEDFDFDLSVVSSICDSIISTFDGYEKKFEDVGFNFGLGLKYGLLKSKVFAVLAAYGLANAILNVIKKVLQINSPSKKAIEFGSYFGIGLSDGLSGKEGLVEKSGEKLAVGLQSAVDDILANNIETDPVIRPIMDLSDVSSGSKRIGKIISGNTLSIGASVNKAYDANHSYTHSSKYQNASDKRENGSEYKSRSEDNSINFSGNSFYVRNDQDIRSLASEIATLTKQQQRSLGASY